VHKKFTECIFFANKWAHWLHLSIDNEIGCFPQYSVIFRDFRYIDGVDSSNGMSGEKRKIFFSAFIFYATTAITIQRLFHDELLLFPFLLKMLEAICVINVGWAAPTKRWTRL
jgi:hypothetical protein